MAPRDAATPLFWTREQAIAALRRGLDRFADGEHSTCQIAAERGIFCRGFRQWDDHEFHRRWKTVLGESTHLSRPQVERLADLWELSEQVLQHVRLTCDARAAVPGPCRGWYEFSNETLARFCGELLGQAVIVSGREIDTNASGLGGAFRETKADDDKA
jgi:hypothetical protein